MNFKTNMSEEASWMEAFGLLRWLCWNTTNSNEVQLNLKHFSRLKCFILSVSRAFPCYSRSSLFAHSAKFKVQRFKALRCQMKSFPRQALTFQLKFGSFTRRNPECWPIFAWVHLTTLTTVFLQSDMLHNLHPHESILPHELAVPNRLSRIK